MSNKEPKSCYREQVRVVDKRLKDGKYYLKKGQILDVIARGVASVRQRDQFVEEFEPF